MLLLALVLLVAGSAAAGPAPERRPCSTSLPRGPQVPAPVVLRTSCGGFLLARDRTVRRLPQRWLDARAGGTGRRYGDDLRIERTAPGRIVLRRAGRVVWRSRHLYRNDGGSIAFGPGAFVFAAWRRGIFVTDLRSPERLLVPGVGLYPLAFLADGTLLVVHGGWGPWVSRVTRDGRVLSRHRYRPKSGFDFDQRTETLHFVTPERALVRLTASSFTAVRPLGDLEGWLWSTRRHVVLSDAESLAVLRNDGSLVSRWRWRVPQGSLLDAGATPSEDGRWAAFRTRPEKGRGTVSLHVLRHGSQRATVVHRHGLDQVGCGVGASFSWTGRFLLYAATDGPALLVDARSGRVRSLEAVIARLPRKVAGERPSVRWASSFAPNDRRRA